MKSSYELKLAQNEREQQLYHKHTFGSTGNMTPTMHNHTNNPNSPVSFTNLSSPHNHTHSFQSQTSLTHFPSPHPTRRLTSSVLSTAISSITYGLSCLIYQTQANRLYECLLMVHEEYINILHLIINRSLSYLLKLNEVKSIDIDDTFVTGKLAGIVPEMKDYFIVLNLKSLKTVVLVFKTENQRDVILMGLKFFLNQGRQFYMKLSQYDPFRAESMMLFLQADKDGGNLLDIEEIISILSELKINKEKLDIESDVLEINKSLYERENIKRPKNASSSELTPIAFEYLLRYYSTKQELSKYFKEYCPMFKLKTKNHKNTIIDCIRNNQKPIMSSVQLRQFYREVLSEQKTAEQLNEVIMKYPLYDGQGKQKFQNGVEEPLLNFDNFCNLICSRLNCLVDLNDQKFAFSLNHNSEDSDLLIHKSMRQQKKNYFDHSLLDYYIYCDLSARNLKRKEKSNYFNLALKRGVKCITLNLSTSLVHHSKGGSSGKNKNLASKLSALVVRVGQKQSDEFLVDDILRDVRMLAFQKNPLPFWIVFDFYQLLKQPNYQQYLDYLSNIIDEILEKQNIFVHVGQKDQKKMVLPSPLELKEKFVLVSNFNAKMVQKSSGNTNSIYEIPQNLSKKLTFSAVKLDFERKGQTCWNSCFLQQDILKSCETAEEENIANYAKKLMVFYVRKPQAQPSTDSLICFRQGIQFVGEDFQKNKEANYIIHSRFAQVPDCAFGYLLKPSYMHTQNTAPLYTNKNFTKAQTSRIKFSILSGQKLILNDILFKVFHIEVFIKGSHSDEQNNRIYRSQKRTQGFYTEINLQCEFIVYNPEMFSIVVMVRNSQNGKVLGGRAVSLTRMREGLRTLQLLDDRMQTKQNSYLLVNYSKKQVNQKDDKANKMQEFLK